MQLTYDEIMAIIEREKAEERRAAIVTKELMKKTLNPIARLQLYFNAKRFMDHVAGMDLLSYQLKKAMKES